MTIAILPAAGCPARYTDYRVEATARRLRRCAHGHAGLRDVTIVYGLLAITPAFQRKIDNLEVWPGGCCVQEAKNKVVCLTCRYSYQPLYRSWERTSRDPSSFDPPLSKLMADFPVLSPSRGPCHVWYTDDPDDPWPEDAGPEPDDEVDPQNFVSYLHYYHYLRGPLVVMEQIVYWSSAEPEVVAQRIAAHLGGFGASVSQKERTYEDLGRREFTLRADHGGRLVEAEVTYHRKHAETCVFVRSVDARAKEVVHLVFPFDRQGG